MQGLKNGRVKKNSIKVNVHIGVYLGGSTTRWETLETDEGSTAGDFLERVLGSGLIRFKKNEEEIGVKKLFDRSLILLNGKNIRYLDGLNTVISENDTIVILKPMVGG